MATDLQQAFGVWRAKHARRAWKPIPTDGAGPGAQLGGSPLLATHESWPACESCQRPMLFFLQLPLAALPTGFVRRGEGILQLFYCSRDDGGCETWRPFSGAHLVRLLRGPAATATPPEGVSTFPARSIDRWRELVDYPHPEEHEALGLVYDYDFAKKRVDVSCDALDGALRGLDLDDDVAETIADAEPGDKLGGWPLWIQSAEYPHCPTCSRQMELVFQIDSEDNLPYMFGDSGCGHITQCPDHPDVLAFGWACM